MAPVLGLLFEDRAAAEAIMRRWHEALGEEDREDVIRIAVVEGTIKGIGPGYSVHIGPDPDRAREAAHNRGERGVIVYMTRVQRMHNAQDSPHLKAFKEDYEERGEYRLAFAVLADGKPVLYERSILKASIVFRDADDIQSQDDPDAAVLLGPGTPMTLN
jgi:hypothetical protein